MITVPGIYTLPSEDYHADPAPQPSLSSSGAWTLATDCPAVFDHERRTRVFKRAFDLGNASHLMTLEPEKFDAAVVVIEGRTKKGDPSPGYTTQDARDQRDAAYAAGRIPLLPSEVDLVRAMRDVLHRHPIGRLAFRDGKPEQSIFWQDAETGIWCRTRPDWMPSTPRYLINWKSAVSVHPDDLQRTIWNHGYFAKSAWEMDGVEAVTGIRPERFCLLFQAKEPPHLVVPVWLDDEALHWGQRFNRKARGIFAWCSRRDHWPGYQPELAGAPAAYTLGLPGWVLADLTKRDEAGAFEPPVMEEV